MTRLKTVDEFYERVAKDLANVQDSKLGLDDLKESLALAAARTRGLLSKDAFDTLSEMCGLETTEAAGDEYTDRVMEILCDKFYELLIEQLDDANGWE